MKKLISTLFAVIIVVSANAQTPRINNAYYIASPVFTNDSINFATKNMLWTDNLGRFHISDDGSKYLLSKYVSSVGNFWRIADTTTLTNTVVVQSEFDIKIEEATTVNNNAYSHVYMSPVDEESLELLYGNDNGDGRVSLSESQVELLRSNNADASGSSFSVKDSLIFAGSSYSSFPGIQYLGNYGSNFTDSSLMDRRNMDRRYPTTILDFYTDVSNVGIVISETIKNITIPGNTMISNGDKICAKVSFLINDGSPSYNVEVTLDGILIFDKVLSPGTPTHNELDILIIRTGSSTARSTASINGNVVQYADSSGIGWAGDIDLNLDVAVSSTGASAGDFTITAGTVSFVPTVQ